eukprot:914939-Pelagomonas_calceolata.AAC.4
MCYVALSNHTVLNTATLRRKEPQSFACGAGSQTGQLWPKHKRMGMDDSASYAAVEPCPLCSCETMSFMQLWNHTL